MDYIAFADIIDFTKMVKGMINMKRKVSFNLFRSLMESVIIVKECIIENKRASITLNNGEIITINLVIAETGYPKQILEIISGYSSPLYCVILAPYISEQTSNICRNSGFGYLDLAGNCFIANGYLYIEIKGNKNEYVSKRSLKSIYERSSAVSSRILRVLMQDVTKVWKMQELATAARCSIGQVSKVKDFLLNQAYIEQNAQGIRIINPKAIMKDWAFVYSKGDEEMIACYSLDSVPVLESRIAEMNKNIGTDCALTGFSGGARYQPVVRYQKVHAYVNEEDLEKVFEYLQLKEVDSGANVILMIRYDDCIDFDSREVKENMIVSPVQAYLDLMKLKGRGEEMAEAILERNICG